MLLRLVRFFLQFVWHDLAQPCEELHGFSKLGPYGYDHLCKTVVLGGTMS